MKTPDTQPRKPHRPAELLEALKRLGFGAAVAVPDGWLGEFLVQIERDSTIGLVRATHEEEALAIACGIRLGGVRTALIVQNAGLLSSGCWHGLSRSALSVSNFDSGLLPWDPERSGILSHP